MNSNYKSPNFENVEIPVEFLVLHYTACDLKKTLSIFMDPQSKVAAHFVIDEDGTVYDLGGFLEGPIRKGAHAGKSKWRVDGKSYEAFNGFSIGVEIVNLNGNIFEYTDEQYKSLQKLVSKLQARFPKLKDPDRIVGHEHIAYWRGKSDPGLKFNWRKFFTDLNMEMPRHHDFHVCNDKDLDFLKAEMSRQSIAADLWTQLSSKLEARIQDREKERYFYSYREFEVDNSGVVPKLGNELPKCFIAILKISSAESIKKLGDLLKLDDPIEQKKSEFLRVGFWRFEFTIDYRNSNILVVKARFNGQYGSADETLLPIYDLEKSFRASGFEKQEIGENQFWEFAQVTETFEQFFKSI